MTDALRFRLAVDDGGEWLVAHGDDLAIGHARSKEVELPLLADVLARHAILRAQAESFHAGAGWSIEPSEALIAAGGAIAVDGVARREPTRLARGDRIELAAAVRARFDVPDPASCSATLEFDRGVECCGAQRVLLLVRGPGGRIGIGRRGVDAVRVGRLAEPVILELGEALTLRCTLGLRLGDQPPRESVAIELPLRERVDAAVPPPARGKPPFFLAIAPIG